VVKSAFSGLDTMKKVHSLLSSGRQPFHPCREDSPPQFLEGKTGMYVLNLNKKPKREDSPFVDDFLLLSRVSADQDGKDGNIP